MDNFLNTNLPGIVWASFLCVAFGLFLLRGRGRTTETRPPFIVQIVQLIVGFFRTILALALIIVGIASFILGQRLQDFPKLASRKDVAHIDIMWLHADSTGGETMLSMSRSDDPIASGNPMLIKLPKSSWVVRAHIIRWPKWAETFGFRPIYRLMGIHSWEGPEEGEPDWSDDFSYSRLGLWNDIVTYGSYFNGFAIEEMDSRIVRTAEGTHYVVAMSKKGIEVNEEITQRAPLNAMIEEEED